MTLAAFARQALLTLSSLLGIAAVPPSEQWTVTQPWRPGFGLSVPIYSLEAASTAIVDQCRLAPDSRISFPRIIHGAHKISLDGGPIPQLTSPADLSLFGDPSFETVRSFYGSPVVPCAAIISGHELQWTAYSYSGYFARIGQFPRIESGYGAAARFDHNFVPETLIQLVAGGLYLLGLILPLLVWRTVSPAMTASLMIACVAFGNYCLASVAGFFASVSMLQAHKFADINLMIGVAAFLSALCFENLIRRPALALYLLNVAAAVATVATAEDGDTIQFGTLLAMPMSAGLFAYALVETGILELRRGPNLATALRLLSLACFVGFFCNDLLALLGINDGWPLFPFGMIGGVGFFALAVNYKILAIYRERDFLHANLQREVERQTLELKRAQGQLVQSEKMASLGLLVAGVAHEINNPVGFILNNVDPLRQRLAEMKESAARDDHSVLGERLTELDGMVELMRRGAQRTAAIVSDLRSFSRVGSERRDSVDVEDALEVTLRLLQHRWADRIEVHKQYGGVPAIPGSRGQLNQVFMNVLANACDAIAERGNLWISTAIRENQIELVVRDDGGGITPEHLDRIFDPFFTTKPQGKGTGLGLSISHGIIADHGGTLEITSQPSHGTTVTIRLAADAPSSSP